MMPSAPSASTTKPLRRMAGGGVCGGIAVCFCQICGMRSGSSGTMARTASSPPRLTCRRYCPNDIPTELPTRKVAGSPTSVSIPAELLTMAVRIIGPTKSTFSARATAMTIGATSITVVAFGRKAQTGATIATSRSRNRRPLPPVACRNRSPTRSNTPVLARTRATTMPPNSRASGPPAVFAASTTSSVVRSPSASSSDTPSRAATAMSMTSSAMTRITPPKIAMVR